MQYNNNQGKLRMSPRQKSEGEPEQNVMSTQGVTVASLKIIVKDKPTSFDDGSNEAVKIHGNKKQSKAFVVAAVSIDKDTTSRRGVLKRRSKGSRDVTS